MRLVVALGGNALLRRGEPMTEAVQGANVKRAAAALAGLIRVGHHLVITHGNGPQVGLLALQAAAGPADGAYPLDVLGAESEGMIGYLIERELANCFPAGALIATLLTQTKVDPYDPAFAHPQKPIGPIYDEMTALRLERERGWSIARDGASWRRVIASPKPLEILETRVISLLAEQGVTVICAGGGGIPVIETEAGELQGIEAVIDKDRASALLARLLFADMLLLLTDVDAVYLDYATPGARAVARTGVAALAERAFAAGSMGPKVEAAVSFVRATGRRAAIGRLEDAAAILSGKAGTNIEPNLSGFDLRPSGVTAPVFDE